MKPLFRTSPTARTSPIVRAAGALVCAALFVSSALAAEPAAPISVLFVGNSYTFGRVDPVMSYNAANVRDLTASMFATNPSGANAFEPHPWGGVPGIFKQFTVEAGLNYDVALSTRNAASLRGHFINSNAAGWDLRSNLSLQTWNKVVLQEQSDEPLVKRPGLSSNPDWVNNYVNKIEDYVHTGTAHTYRERDFFPGATTTEQTNNCVAATGASATACNTQRIIPANANARASTDVYLYQSWARPNLVDGAFVTSTDPVTGAVTRSTTPATTFFPNLESMTTELATAYRTAASFAGGVKGISPVGEAFMRAVASGVATRNMWGTDALTDGLIDLWFDDGTHASKYGSYLSALTLFGTLTGLDPVSLGANEQAAADLGISPEVAVILQRVASEQLAISAVPEPTSAALMLGGVAGLLVWRRSRSSGTSRGARRSHGA